MSNATKILILPAGVVESEKFRQDALARGEELVGASSLPDDPIRTRYTHWVFLPSVHEPEFQQKLQDAVRDHLVGTIYCPHNILHGQIASMIARGALSARLLNPSPAQQQVAAMSDHLQRARSIRSLMQALSAAPPEILPTLNEIASILMFCNTITGQSSDEKLAALLALFPQLPKGDVVEIGAFWGRSSFALAWAADRYGVGALLAVDPWNPANSVQSSSPEIVQQDTGKQDWEMVHQGFKVALALFGPRRVNFLRLPSESAAPIYSRERSVSNDGFGETRYSGRIALLHIDGNHDYDCVIVDRDLWADFVAPGGWIVFDDYVWAHGDGPKRAADEFIAANGACVERTFEVGKAMFIQLR